MEREAEVTPLHSRHAAAGAKMTDFRGWNMPLWYPSGAVAEHRVVITHAGLFDTSHMGVLSVSGPDSRGLLQRCFTRDLDACSGRAKGPLCLGRAIHGAFLNEDGGFVDDAILYQTGPEDFLCVVNSGLDETVRLHLIDHGGGLDVSVDNSSKEVGKLDIQGPESVRILAEVIKDPVGILRDMRYFGFKGHFSARGEGAEVTLNDGTPVMVSRTGYTGELGFEILAAWDAIPSVWDRLLEAGREKGLIPCGLAARDSLRAGAVLPLSRQDVGPWPFINNPWHTALPFDRNEAGFTKRFVGDSVLVLRDTADWTLPFCGYDPRKVPSGGTSEVFDSSGRPIGTVLTCVADMAIARYGSKVFGMASPDKPVDFVPTGLICGFVKVKSRLAPGTEVDLRDKRRRVPVMIVDDVRPHRSARCSISEMFNGL
ncbi:MAG: aminomethyl transferase family protein [Pseudomonadota bacterium]